MNSEFDYAEYAIALNHLIMMAEKLPMDATDPEMAKASEKICHTLKIARVEAFLYKIRNGVPDKVQLFSDEDYDINRSFKYEKRIESGEIAGYIVYPYKAAPDWTEKERENINVFLTALFLFNGRSRMRDIAKRLTFYDTALNIPNMTLFIKNTSELIAKGEFTNYCCCRFNLRNYSFVNRQLGRESGTLVMKRFVDGLQNILKQNGCVCRIGGDNFLIYFKKELVEAVKEYLMGTKIMTDNKLSPEITVSAYAGFYRVDESCCSSDDVMDKIIVAMNQAKVSTSDSFVFYDEGIREKQRQRQWVESLFLSAIENEEFLVYYQPKVNLKNYTIDGAEALCRWKHDGELIPPFKFIPMLEMSSNICVLDFYMLEHVCRDIRRWLDEGRNVVRISVNLSRVHLGNEMLVEHIMEIIEKYNVPHKYLEIELTETTTEVDYNELKKLVFQLRNEGIKTSIDDFGTGFSSLNLVYDLPWNIIKIDKSFLPTSNNNVSKQKQIILKHIITMAQNLGIECIVEGVETVEHIALLKDNNCFRAQGFHFDKPLSVEEFESRLIKND